MSPTHMHRCRRLWGWLAWLAVAVVPSVASAAPRAKASVAPQSVGKGGYVKYTISATTEGNKSIQIVGRPDFAGAFRVVGTTNAPSYLVRNGHASRSLRRIYRLRALRKGAHDIEAPTVRVGQRELHPKTVTVRVGAAGKTPKSSANSSGSKRRRQGGHQRQGDKRVYVDYALDPSAQPYVGQQVTLSYFLYADAFRTNVHPQPPDEPSLDDFWIEDLSRQASGNRQTVRIHGKPMQRATLRSYALFPLKAGSTRIEALTVDAIVGGFLRGQKKLHLSADPIDLKVRALPADAPASFEEGNVGQWSFEVTADRIKAAMGRPIAVRVRVRGDGQLGRVALPELPDIDGTRLAGRDQHSKSRVKRGVVGGQKTAKYTLVAQREGTITIPSLRFAYFDPAKERYETVDSRPIDIKINGGKVTLARQKAPSRPDKPRADSPSRHADAVAGLTDQLEPPRAPVFADDPADGPADQPVWWAVMAAGGLGLVGVWLEGPLRRRLQQGRPRRRRGQAVERANTRLEAADNETPAEGLDRVRDALSIYAVEVAGVPAGGVSETELGDHLDARGVPGDLAQQCADVLRQLDAARYAPDKEARAARVEELSSLCRGCIDQLEDARRAGDWSASAAAASAAASQIASVVIGVLTVGLLTAAGLTPRPAYAGANADAQTTDAQAAVDRAVEAQKKAQQEAQQDAQKQAQWQKAADNWQQVAALKPRSADIQYNLGTALAHTGDIGQARLALERAGWLAPGTAHIEANRDLVRQLVRLDQVEHTRGRQAGATTAEGLFWWRMATQLSANMLPMAAALLVWLVLGAAIWRRLATRRIWRDTALIIAIVATVGLVAAMAGALAQRHILDTANTVVVTAEDVTLRQGPNKHAGLADIDTIVVPGVLLPAPRERDGWVKLGFADDSTAWTRRDNVDTVRPHAASSP